ncbi:hypothetical protein [Limnohabitans radicicola]|uniref:Uncharacterized protein n=1 Tax=Limnohabitans radicicola TaxID=2771427 RepID=A0A927FGP3_9BURK|nr:hypothetical protein [Limnohabitans radicicola]MBD8051104.1 hypothetical protein [Limnohabitans radicicola]
MPTIEHETSPAIAAEVARVKRFLAGPIKGDSGMNAFIVGHVAGPYCPDQAANCGAVMRFEWTGPVIQGSIFNGYSPNQLFDEHPHRAFIPAGTNSNLKLIEIVLVRGCSWEDAIVDPSFSLANLCSWLSSKRAGWRQAVAERLEEEMAAIVATQPNISVCVP